jgi:signal transduction histidine kinase/CheY-like chemotaxis protein
MFAEGGAVLRCHDLYQRHGDVHTAGGEFQGSDYPGYFRALAGERVIAARDARTDPRTGELAEAYLVQLGITSMMDVPIQLEGRTVGVLCHEHAGPPRRWTIEEQTFAASLADHISLALEVAQRRSAEAELRESETRLAQTLEAVPAGVFVVNASGVPEYANQRAQQILGRGIVAGTKADDIPEVYQAFIAGTEEPYPAGRMPVVRALAGEALAVDDMEIRRPDRVVPLHVEAAPLRDTEDRVVAAVAVFVDVTETRRLEEQLRQAAKMEAVGRLAGGVAHDFNNLLTVISGNTELRLADAPAGSSGREDLEEILRAAHRAAELTRQLLAFSRQQVLKPKLLYLADSLRGMQRMLPRLLGEDIELTIRAEPDAGPVMADPAQIEQVILNLAINARDAMPRGGLLQIETCNARLTAEDSRKYPDSVPGDYALLKVCDSGEGISPEVLKHIFDPFFTTKEPGKGTGLGLATVFGIVKQSGGYIWVDSTPGSGTTFRIYLPRTEESKSAGNETQAKPDAKRGNETILLVEDEEQVRRFAGRVLRRMGYTVREASGGEEALRLLGGEDAPPDLLLTDLVMSGMSGRELAEAMTEQHPSMAVLYMSGYTEDAVVQRGVREESVEFIQKPFSPDDLARRVREVLDRPESGPST